MIGTKGIYKVGKGKIITLDQENIEDFEVSIIETLKRECKKQITRISTQCRLLEILVICIFVLYRTFAYYAKVPRIQKCRINTYDCCFFGLTLV